jgi:hypothetical protein
MGEQQHGHPENNVSGVVSTTAATASDTSRTPNPRATDASGRARRDRTAAPRARPVATAAGLHDGARV